MEKSYNEFYKRFYNKYLQYIFRERKTHNKFFFFRYFADRDEKAAYHRELGNKHSI